MGSRGGGVLGCGRGGVLRGGEGRLGSRLVVWWRQGRGVVGMRSKGGGEVLGFSR